MTLKTTPLADGDIVSLGLDGAPPFARYNAADNTFVVDVASLNTDENIGFLHVVYVRNDDDEGAEDFDSAVITDDSAASGVQIVDGKPHVVTCWGVDDLNTNDHVIQRNNGKVYMRELPDRT